MALASVRVDDLNWLLSLVVALSHGLLIQTSKGLPEMIKTPVISLSMILYPQNLDDNVSFQYHGITRIPRYHPALITAL